MSVGLNCLGQWMMTELGMSSGSTEHDLDGFPVGGTDLGLKQDALEMGIWQRQRQGHSILGWCIIPTRATSCGERLPSGLGSVLIAGLRLGTTSDLSTDRSQGEQ
jgi:hypothetical protein